MTPRLPRQDAHHSRVVDVEITAERPAFLTGRRPPTNFANLIRRHFHATIKLTVWSMTTPKSVERTALPRLTNVFLGRTNR